MKKVLFICFILLTVLSLKAQNNTEQLVGKWTYSAPSAPYGYDKGEMEIKSDNGKLKGELKIQDLTIRIPEIKQNGNTYTSTVYIDGMDVDIEVKITDGLLEGKGFAGGWEIPVTFKKAN